MPDNSSLMLTGSFMWSLLMYAVGGSCWGPSSRRFTALVPPKSDWCESGLERSCPATTPSPFKERPVIRPSFSCLGCASSSSLFYAVTKHPWVQVPAGQIGVVIAQVGKPTPIGAKSGIYDPAFGNFTDSRSLCRQGREKGVQRPVLSPGTLAPIHPVAFLVITKPQVFGVPVSDQYRYLANTTG